MYNPMSSVIRFKPGDPRIPPLLLAFVLIAGSVGNEPARAAEGGASWPQFRGPSASGQAPAPEGGGTLGLPLRWSETENVVWKTAIEHQGWSTPVIEGDQIWLTTATKDGQDYFAIRVNADTGAIEYYERLFHSDNPEPLGNNVNGYASPTPVIEPGRVYIHFGSYGTACLDTAPNKVLWTREDLECRHYRGPGSSPILFENLLYLTFDGADLQYVIALDKNTGETVWKTDRTTEWNDFDRDGNIIREGDLRKAYSTPIIAEVNGQPQLISPASYGAFSYDARTGEELWKTHGGSYTAVPQPSFGNGLVYLTTGYRPATLWAIRPDGRGDITDTHVVWQYDEGRVPRTPTPLLLDDLIFMVSNNGEATCLNALTGEEVWAERIGGNYLASPIYGDGRIYFSSTQGKTTVIRAGREFQVLAENRLDEGLMATPSVTGKALILRTKTHLYRIESGDSVRE